MLSLSSPLSARLGVPFTALLALAAGAPATAAGQLPATARAVPAPQAAPPAPRAGLDAEPAEYGWPRRGIGRRLIDLPADQPGLELAPPPTRRAVAWESWGRALEQASYGSSESEAARVQLALLAHARGADDDAWRHVTALADSPAALAALVPRLLPGVPAGVAALPGGLPPALPQGVVLRPALPPPSGDPVPAGWLEARSASLEGLVVGDARLRMTVELRLDGVNVQFDWLSGGPAAFRCRIPCPQGFERNSEYADWDRSDDLGVAHEVRVSEELPEWRLWLRFRPQRRSLPAVPPDRLSTQLGTAGLEFVTPGGDSDVPTSIFADELGRLLGVPVELRDPDDPPSDRSSAAAPVSVDLLSPESAETKLLALASLVERYVLAPQAAPPSLDPPPATDR